jgi:8-oxo-dGTP pyrophosphatase MutT (NUDIX family)
MYKVVKAMATYANIVSSMNTGCRPKTVSKTESTKWSTLEHTSRSAAQATKSPKSGEDSLSGKRPPSRSVNFISSYGVACVRRNADTGCYEILMIKKRNTYAFIEFVRGMYDPYKDHDLEYMFSTMTITEKSMIQTRNFSVMWNYCNGEPSKVSERSVYARSMRKYMMLCERAENILLQLISNTTNATLLWEIPKGRPNKKETPLISATREFEEETGLSKDSYRILFDEGTIEYSFVDCGVRYKYVYYLAVLSGGITPTYDYSNEHMLWELSELRFVTSSAIQEMNNQRLAKTARIIIKKAKKYL